MPGRVAGVFTPANVNRWLSTASQQEQHRLAELVTSMVAAQAGGAGPSTGGYVSRSFSGGGGGGGVGVGSFAGARTSSASFVHPPVPSIAALGGGAAALNSSAAAPLGGLNMSLADATIDMPPSTPSRRGSGNVRTPQTSAGHRRAREKYFRTGIWKCPMCNKTQVSGVGVVAAVVWLSLGGCPVCCTLFCSGLPPS